MWRNLDSRTQWSAVMVLLAMLTACGPGTDARLLPSGHAVSAPEAGQTFTSQQQMARGRIRSALRQAHFEREETPFGPGYTLEDVVDMRAPREHAPSPACDPGRDSTGILLVHGLSDSPYTLRGVAGSLSDVYPCALIRNILLPGHGTVPGDLRSVDRNELRAAVDHATNDMLRTVDTLYLIGYSTGAALVLEQADRRRDDDRLAGLVLLSPALDLGNPLDWLTPWLRHVRPWLSLEEDRDAAKYESFPLNAVAEAYLMLRELGPFRISPLQIPVFMVSTADDITVDPRAALHFFCEQVAAPRRTMIWYRAEATAETPPLQCRGLRIRESATPELRVVTHSHVGITLPPDDPHYGVDGRYRHCLRYRPDPTLFRQCREDDAATVYGEPARLLEEGQHFRGQLVRRTTFNPDHREMMEALHCFLTEDCSP
ncbi:MAG: alpha/beta hydrolase [Pseudomonadota bacterium]